MSLTPPEKFRKALLPGPSAPLLETLHWLGAWECSNSIVGDKEGNIEKSEARSNFEQMFPRPPFWLNASPIVVIPTWMQLCKSRDRLPIGREDRTDRFENHSLPTWDSRWERSWLWMENAVTWHPLGRFQNWQKTLKLLVGTSFCTLVLQIAPSVLPS